PRPCWGQGPPPAPPVPPPVSSWTPPMLDFRPAVAHPLAAAYSNTPPTRTPGPWAGGAQVVPPMGAVPVEPSTSTASDRVRALQPAAPPPGGGLLVRPRGWKAGTQYPNAGAPGQP